MSVNSWVQEKILWLLKQSERLYPHRLDDKAFHEVNPDASENDILVPTGDGSLEWKVPNDFIILEHNNTTNKEGGALDAFYHLPLVKIDATIPPTVNDDSSEGYAVSSPWYDVVAGIEYICLDASVGAAEWKKGTLPADTDEVTMPQIGSPTYTTLDDLINGVQSAGVITGGAITDGGSGTVDVSSLQGLIKTTNSNIGENKFFDLAAQTAVALTDNSTNFLAVDYNGGTPQLIVGVTNTANGHTIFNLGKVYREGTVVDIITSGLHIEDFSKRTQQHHVEEAALHFVSGAAVGETGVRSISITAGIMYAGLNRILTDAIDTSGADDFEYYYYDGAAWQETDETQIDNLQYNDIAAGLATLSNNRYGVHWVYKGTHGSTYVVYGQNSYFLTEAEAVQPPAALPPHVSGFGVLRAKIIIYKSAAVFTEIQSVLDVNFTAGVASNHNELNGLQGGSGTTYYHLPLCKFDATAPPTVNNDSSEGYSPTSIWTDVTNDKAYICLDASVGAAVWSEITPVASSPLTTKGDIYTYNTADARLAVGSNGQVFTADSAEATGNKWATPTGVVQDKIEEGNSKVEVVDTGIGQVNIYLDGAIAYIIKDTGIFDANGNELFLMESVSGAVNQISASNAATGNAPFLKAGGSDSNVDLNLDTKGISKISFLIDGSEKGYVDANGVNSDTGFVSNGNSGWTGSFTNGDGDTVEVDNGIITDVHL